MRISFRQLIGFGATFLMLLVMLDAAKLFSGNLKFTEAETEVSFWGRRNYQPDLKTIQRTGQSIEVLLKNSSQHPSYLYLSANAFAWQAYWEPDMDVQDQFVQQSIAAQTQAVKARPAHRQSWIKLIEYLSNTNKSGEKEVWARNRVAALYVNTETL